MTTPPTILAYPTVGMTAPDDFFDMTIPNDIYFLNQIKLGRFILENDDSVIYDTKRNVRSKFDFNKTLPINTRKSEYLKYEIFLHTPFKCRRKIYLHKFVYMYHTKELVPEGCSVVHKDDNIYNCRFFNLKIQYPRVEKSAFFDTNIPDEDWYYSQVMENRFEMLDNGNKIYDRQRDKVTTPGKWMDNKHQGDNCKKRLEYNIVATGKKLHNRKIAFHRLAWMVYNQKPIPTNHDVHHKDGDRLNNSGDNLDCIERTLHALHHSNEDKIKQRQLLDFVLLLKYKICFKDKKLCSSCNRLLPHDHFYSENKESYMLKLSSWCKECATLRAKLAYESIYQFPPGVLNDKIILDIRFKFHILCRNFRTILFKYSNENITKDQLRDILLGNTYTHIDLMHGQHIPPYKELDYIGNREYNHMLNAMKYGDFTLEEISLMYGRSMLDIQYVLTTGNYKEKLDKELAIDSIIHQYTKMINY